VRRHTESNNLIILTVLLEFKRVIALIAINNEQPICANNPPLYILIKVLQPLQAKLIYCPAVLRDRNNLIMWQAALLVPGREVVLTLEDDKGRDRPPYRVDALDYRSLLSITLLHRLWLFSTL
jgi:hypothetical protein